MLFRMSLTSKKSVVCHDPPPVPSLSHSYLQLQLTFFKFFHRGCPFLLQWAIFPTIFARSADIFVWRSPIDLTFLREAPTFRSTCFMEDPAWNAVCFRYGTELVGWTLAQLVFGLLSLGGRAVHILRNQTSSQKMSVFPIWSIFFLSVSGVRENVRDDQIQCLAQKRRRQGISSINDVSFETIKTVLYERNFF